MGTVALIASVAMVLGIGSVMEGFAERSIVGRLDDARRSFKRHLESRQRLLESMVALVAETPVLKTTLEIDDSATAVVHADDTRRVLHIGFVMLTDRSAVVLADTTESIAAGSSAVDRIEVRAAMKGERFAGLRDDSDRVYIAASAPVTTGGQLRGVVVVGELVDARVAQEFAEAIGADVMFVQGEKPVVWSAGRDGEFDPNALAAAVASSARKGDAATRVRHGEVDQFVAVEPVGEHSRLVLSRSAEELPGLRRALWAWVIGFGVLGAAAAMALSHWIARRLSRPLLRLADAAGQIAEGNLDTVVGEFGMEETARLGNAFNDMTRRIRQLVENVRHKAGVLQEQKDQLESSNRMRSNFLATASHELRTPIASVASAAEILIHHGGDEEEGTRQEFLSVIDSETTRLAHLLDQLMDLTQIEAGVLDWHLTDFDLREAVEESIEAFSRSHPGRRVVLHCTEVACGMRGDRSRLQQVLDQLLDNAAKFTPEESEVLVCLTADETGYQLSVADRGPGFSTPEERERIFEWFMQGGDIMTSKPRGMGLGLSICRAIAAAHNGGLQCEERPGGGAVFVLLLTKTAFPRALVTEA